MTIVSSGAVEACAPGEDGLVEAGALGEEGAKKKQKQQKKKKSGTTLLISRLPVGAAGNCGVRKALREVCLCSSVCD